MDFDVTLALGLIVVLGIGMQWLGRIAGFPSIVLLLVTGVIVGPVTGLVNPEELFGDLLNPGVTLAVGLILFESGFSLDLREVHEGRRVIVRLITIGVVITFVLAAVASKFLLGIGVHEAVLLGAILIVSGPTVVIPILRETRVREPTNAILRWEGTVIDPLGAAIGLSALHLATSSAPHVFGAILGVLATAATGVGIGIGGAALLVAALRWYRVPDDLQVPVALAFAVGVFVAAEAAFGEAGLFATTAFGLALRNQRYAVVTGIRRFQENMSPLILGTLFIVLAAGVTRSEFQGVILGALALTAVLVLVVRPLAVLGSTARTSLPWRDRAFVGSLAPRGIVAASTSSVYALVLEQEGFADAAAIPAATFVVIVVAGALYGLSARPVARLLGVAAPTPRGIAIVSGEHWARTLAGALHALGAPVLLVATDREDLRRDRSIDYRVFTEPIDSDEFKGELEQGDIGSALVASTSSEHNTVAMIELMELLGRRAVFHLPPEEGHHGGVAADLWEGTPDMHKAFDPGMTMDEMRRRLQQPGALVTFTWAEGEWRKDDRSGPGIEDVLPLFAVDPGGRIAAVTVADLQRLLSHPEHERSGTRLLTIGGEATP